MIESRSVVAQGPGQGEGTDKEHKDTYWLIEMSYITIEVVIAQLYSLLKTH